MPRYHWTRSACGLAGLTAASILTCCLLPGAAPVEGKNAASSTLPPGQEITHVLNRLAFGPRPGDVERVKAMGINAWLEQQLNPETVDDSAVDAKLSRLTSLGLSPQNLMLAYITDVKMVRMKALQRKAAKQADEANDAAPAVAVTAPAATGAPGAPGAAGDGLRLDMLLNEADTGTPSTLPQYTSVEAVGELEVAKLLRAAESNRQLQEVLVDFWSNHFNEDVRKGPVRSLKIVDEREVIRPHVFGKFRDLLGASAHSPAMMFYLDNASSTRTYTGMGQGQGRFGQNRLRRRARPGLMGELLGVDTTPDAPNRTMPDAATPGMAAPTAASAVPTQPTKRRGGLNENYAREIMELHTLGVDGGYTQKDVQEVARCFTGWSLARQTGMFQFFPLRHDTGQKIVLGHVIPAGGGMEDGEKVLDILASHPSTAHHISRELCTRLVSDDPSASLVDAATQVFQNTGGDLRSVVRSIITSPEFFSAASYRSKVKSPFEFAVSAIRALGGEIDVPDPAEPRGRLRLLSDGAVSSRGKGVNQARRGGRRFQKSLVQQVADMGEPLFAYEAPTGYPERSHDWISTGGLVARFNYALALANGQVAEVKASPAALLGSTPPSSGQAVIDQLSRNILGGDISPTTMTVLKSRLLPGQNVNTTDLVALMIGSPEFQRR